MVLNALKPLIALIITGAHLVRTTAGLVHSWSEPASEDQVALAFIDGGCLEADGSHGRLRDLTGTKFFRQISVAVSNPGAQVRSFGR
jgi:hypothetical protein